MTAWFRGLGTTKFPRVQDSKASRDQEGLPNATAPGILLLAGWPPQPVSPPCDATDRQGWGQLRTVRSRRQNLVVVCGLQILDNLILAPTLRFAGRESAKYRLTTWRCAGDTTLRADATAPSCPRPPAGALPPLPLSPEEGRPSVASSQRPLLQVPRYYYYYYERGYVVAAQEGREVLA